MKSFTNDPKSANRPRAAAVQRQEADEARRAQPAPADHGLQRAVDESPRMTEQRTRIASGGETAQRASKDEEMMGQPKYVAQRVGEDEEMMGQPKYVAQRVGEDEEMMGQPKYVAQRVEEDEEMMGQPKYVAQRMGDDEQKLGQPKPAPSTAASKPVQANKNATGMPEGVKGKMEQTFDTDFSSVKVHPSSSKAPEVGALAFTQGSDIHFAPGQFKPESSSGQQLLGHELTHVVQQSEGRVQPTTEVAGLPVNDSPALEKEADDMGAKARK